MLACAYYTISSIHKMAQPFIEIAVSGAVQVKSLLASNENVIHSISPKARESWISNLEDPYIEARGGCFNA